MVYILKDRRYGEVFIFPTAGSFTAVDAGIFRKHDRIIQRQNFFSVNIFINFRKPEQALAKDPAAAVAKDIPEKGARLLPVDRARFGIVIHQIGDQFCFDMTATVKMMARHEAPSMIYGLHLVKEKVAQSV